LAWSVRDLDNVFVNVSEGKHFLIISIKSNHPNLKHIFFFWNLLGFGQFCFSTQKGWNGIFPNQTLFLCYILYIFAWGWKKNNCKIIIMNWFYVQAQTSQFWTIIFIFLIDL
jgi:hypothetical protein